MIAEADNSYQINNTFFDSGWDYSYHHNLIDNILDIYTNLNNITSHINAYDQGYSFVTGPVNYIESHDENRLIYQSTEFQGHSFEEAYKMILWIMSENAVAVQASAMLSLLPLKIRELLT